MADYNLGLINVELLQKYEVHTNKQIFTENEKLEKANELMGDIERFLMAFEQDKDENGAIDWRQKPERIQLVQKLRQQVKDEFPEMFPDVSSDPNNPNSNFVWNKDEVKSLIKHVNNYVDTILQNKISQISEHVLQHQQDSSKATEIFASFVRRRSLIETILANMRQR
jgi:hypothetical protein